MLHEERRGGGLIAHPGLVWIGGGFFAALVMVIVGMVCVVRGGLRVYRKLRVLRGHPVVCDVRAFSGFARFAATGEELSDLLTRAFLALDRISRSMALLREAFTSPMRLLRSSAAATSRVQNSGN